MTLMSFICFLKDFRVGIICAKIHATSLIIRKKRHIGSSPNKIGWCSVKKVQARNFIKTKTLAQVLSCEICEISKNTFSYRTPPLAASVPYQRLLITLIAHIWSKKDWKLSFITLLCNNTSKNFRLKYFCYTWVGLKSRIF